MRRILAIVLAAALFLALTVQAGAAMTLTTVTRDLSFSGTSANCSATVKDSGKTINATMELWSSNMLWCVWMDSGLSRVDLDGSVTVPTGMTFTLKVYGTINGVPFEAAPLERSN